MSAKVRDPVLDEIFPALPPRVREAVLALPSADRQSLLEIRLRRGRAAMAVAAEGDLYLRCAGQPVICTENEWEAAVRLVTQSSIYALERELAAGFVTLAGGHRVGLVGRAVLEGERVRGQSELSSMNYRIARQMIGIADRVMPYVFSADGTRVMNVLILSGPGLGKTTLLRDIARQLSTGSGAESSMGAALAAAAMAGFKVGIVDERSEIAACSQGVPQNELGPRADVIDGCPKAVGIMIMIRTMSPDVVITDEVGRADDADALEEASRCGVSVIATAHALDPEDAMRRPAIRDALARGAFDRAIVLGRSLGLGTCERIVDLRSGRDLAARPFRLASGGETGGVRR